MEQHEHLWQRGQGELPHQVGQKNGRAAEECQAAVEESRQHKIGDEDREKEKQHGYRSDHAIPPIHDIRQAHLPVVLDQSQAEGAHPGVERGLIEIGKLT